MPEPLFKPKNFKSLDQAQAMASEVENTLKSTTCSMMVMRSIDKIFNEAECKRKKGELEMAYVLYFRCMLTMKRLMQMKDFKKDCIYYQSMIGEQLQNAELQLESLQPILKNAYERMKEFKVEPKRDENMVEARVNCLKPVVQDTSINGLKVVSYITSIELNEIITTRENGGNTTLIIDVRSSDEFRNSRMNIEDIINIPVNQLPDGLTPYRIQNEYLNEEFRPFFKKRKEYDWVILVDWFWSKDMKDPNLPIQKMMTALVKWDLKDGCKKLPVILDGGFDDWLSRYPTWTTNPSASPPRIEDSFSKLMLDSISFGTAYDFEDENSSIEKKAEASGVAAKPSFDRSTKPGFQEKKTETVNNGVKEYPANNIMNKPARAEQEGDSKIAKSNMKNGEASEKFKDDLNMARIMYDSSDTDDETGKEYSQRGRRSALANTFNRKILRERKMNDKEGDRNENEDSELNTRFVKVSEGNYSSMKRSSSTPNIAKQSTIEGNRPSIDRSTKPSSNDDQLNMFTMHNSYNSSEIGRGLTGLKNLGNTCYMNSIIQCLSNTEQLRKSLLFLDSSNINGQSKTKGYIARALKTIITQLWNGESASASCKELKAIVGEHRDTFRGYEQQDSHEFLTILIDWLHEDLKQVPLPGKLDGADENSGEKAWGEFTNKNNSIIRNLFYGQLKSTVCCSFCDKESITFEPFSNLSLPLPTEEKCSLADCLRLYMSNENIPGWQCPDCKTPRNATKKLDITKLPPLLVIHLKRFMSDGWCRKCLTNVEFPSMLDMSSFVSGNEHRFRRYRLYAVSNHYGTMESGHYTAYCLNTPNGGWYNFDDQDVTPLPGAVPKSPAAYIVFYQYIPD